MMCACISQSWASRSCRITAHPYVPTDMPLNHRTSAYSVETGMWEIVHDRSRLEGIRMVAKGRGKKLSPMA